MARAFRKLRRLMRSARVRVTSLVLCAIVPILLLISIGAVFERDRTLAFAHERVRELARIAAEQQNDIIQEAETLLGVLSHVHPISRGNTERCRLLLETITDDHPAIANVMVVDAKGAPVCSGRATGPDFNVADRSYFRTVMVDRPSAYALSEVLISKRDGLLTIVAAAPLYADDTPGVPTGAILASLKLSWFSRFAERVPATDAHSAMVIDARNGLLLTSTADNAGFMGQNVQNHPLLQAFRRDGSGGAIDAADFAGTEQIFGFAPLPGTDGHMFIAVGLARDEVLGAANRRLRVELAIAVVVACLATLLASVAAHAWLLRPGAEIAAIVQGFGMGALHRRIDTRAIRVVEMRHLATTFNAMADAIQEHEQELRETHAALALSETLHRTLSENMTDLITRMDADFNRIYVSPACETLLGYSQEELVGRNGGTIVHPHDRQMFRASLEAPLRQGAATARASYRSIHKSGAPIWLETQGQRLPDGSGFVLVTRDITERKTFEASLEAANAMLERYARQDGLTGLANRRRFDEALDMEWRRAAREAEPLALLMLDIDRFKHFNDSYGHPSGDECLRRVADCVSTVLRRPADLAARYGGEEIAVILPSTDLEGAGHIAELILAAVAALGIVHPSNEPGVVTVSIGAAVVRPGPNSRYRQDLLARADAALYRAKHEGRNCVRLADDAPAQEIGIFGDTKTELPRVLAGGS